MRHAHRAGCRVVQVPDVVPSQGTWAHHLAEDLLAKVKRGDYRWPDGVAWVVGECHRLLTGGEPDGVYVRKTGAGT